MVEQHVKNLFQKMVYTKNTRPGVLKPPSWFINPPQMIKNHKHWTFNLKILKYINVAEQLVKRRNKTPENKQTKKKIQTRDSISESLSHIS